MLFRSCFMHTKPARPSRSHDRREVGPETATFLFVSPHAAQQKEPDSFLFLLALHGSYTRLTSFARGRFQQSLACLSPAAKSLPPREVCELCTPLPPKSRLAPVCFHAWPPSSCDQQHVQLQQPITCHLEPHYMHAELTPIAGQSHHGQKENSLLTPMRTDTFSAIKGGGEHC